MLLAIVFLGLLFIAGLITTLFNFPSKKFEIWVQSVLAKQTQSSNLVTKIPSKRTAEVRVRSSENGGKDSPFSSKVELKSVFATFDRNKDGFITKQELRDSFKNIGIFMEEKDVADIVTKVDANKDGLIDLDEFSELCKSMMGKEETEGEENGDENNKREGINSEDERERDLKDAFNVFDGDKDGLITVEELRLVLSSLDLPEGMRLEDCKEMIRKVDMDGDGMVNFEEFKKMMKSGVALVPIT